MQENQIIGISGVFVLTLCLIALYHMMGKLGRHGNRSVDHMKRAKQPEQDRRSDDLKKSSGNDDAWLLWSPELDERAGPSKPGFPTTTKQGPLATFVRINTRIEIAPCELL